MSNPINLVGYVTVTGRDSKEMHNSVQGFFVEQIAPKTFQRALMDAKDVDLLLDHDKSQKLGSIKQGNLQLWEDNIGLRANATITDLNLIERAKKGELNGWSFTFKSKVERWIDLRFLKNQLKRRLISEIDLVEVSLLLNKQPTYMGTSVEVRALNHPIDIYQRELEILKLKSQII
jgi:uncharacterized protein